MNTATDESAIEPVQKQLALRCSVEHAFAVFTREIGTWWPLVSHSIGLESAVSVRMEQRVDGKLLETTADGTVHTWGTIATWSPPDEIAFTWHPGREPSDATFVEVRFRELEPGRTEMTLHHSGWEVLGEQAAETRDGYHTGWDAVLERYCAKTPAHSA